MTINQHPHPHRHEMSLQPGEQQALCRCWQSQRFPFCDGSHRHYNETHQDQTGPIIVSVGQQCGDEA